MERSSPEFASGQGEEDVAQEKEFWYWWARKTFFHRV